MKRAERAAWAVVAVACVPALVSGAMWWNAAAPPRPAMPAVHAGTPPAQAPAPAPEVIAARARAHGLLVESVGRAPQPGAAALTVSGSEADVLAFAAALESGPPAIRLAGWSIQAMEGGAVRLRARAMAADHARPAMPAPARALFATALAVATAADAPQLAGIVGRLPDDAVALVRAEDGRAVSVQPGAEAPGGWRLEALSADAAIFVRGQERARVPLPPAE